MVADAGARIFDAMRWLLAGRLLPMLPGRVRCKGEMTACSWRKAAKFVLEAMASGADHAGVVQELLLSTHLLRGPVQP